MKVYKMENSGQKCTNKDANCVKAHDRIKWTMGVRGILQKKKH